MRIKSMTALIFAVCLAVFALLPVPSFAASTASLTVGIAKGNVDQTLTIPITVDNPATIAGAAFTIQYSSSLTVTVDSTFFDTFYNQLDDPNLTTMGPPVDLGGGSYKFPVLDDKGGPVTDDNGAPVYVTIPPEVDGITYSQPLITNTVTDGDTASLHLSAARVMPAESGSDTTLFKLLVSLKSGEPAGTYPISIIPTTLNNTDAGYDANGETIDLVVGSDLNATIESGNAFPVVIDDADYSTHVTAGQAVFTEAGLDSDSDGLPDSWERQYFGDITTSDGKADSDQDGYTDLQEYTNTTDPTHDTTATGLTGYSACTDARVADSLQSVKLSTSGSSAPGGTLVVSATYNAGTEANSGIDVSIFFNSSKVTYIGYNTDTFIAAGNVTAPDVANVQDDTGNMDNDSTTDKMIQMSWSSTNDWSGVSLPAVLADLNFTVNQASKEGDELPFNIIDNSQAAGYAFCGQGVVATVTIIVNNPPDKPTMTSPTDGATGVSLMPELIGGPYNDLDKDPHTMTWWQIATDKLFTDGASGSLVYNEKTDTYLESIIIPPNLILDVQTLYYWRVMYTDGISAGQWSDIHSFTTTSTGAQYTDGVRNEDIIADSKSILPGFADGHGDPINTDTQKMFASKLGNVQIGIQAEKGAKIEKCGAFDPKDFNGKVPPVPHMPYGLIEFALTLPPENTDGIATVTIYFSNKLPKNFVWLKYDPNKAKFFDYADYAQKYDGINDAVVVSDDRMSVTLKIKDGGVGDLVKTPDGRIIDPSGPGDEGGGSSGGTCFIDTLTR